jgi:anti-sigma factor NepR-like protein
MVVSSARSMWTEDLSKGGNQDRGKTSAVRARQRAIGRELRRYFDDVANEPVPDEFIELLRRIDDSKPPNKKPS